MELRKDPITQSWVILGQREVVAETPEQCPLDPARIDKIPAISPFLFIVLGDVCNTK